MEEYKVRFHEIHPITSEKMEGVIYVSLQKGYVFVVHEINKDVLVDLNKTKFIISEFSKLI